MAKIKWVLMVSLIVMLVALPLLGACGEEEVPTTPTTPQVTLYVGGTFALTGAYAEDTAAVLSA